MLKKILLISAALFSAVVLSLVVLIIMQPDEYALDRSATIDAPVDVVFAQVNDLRQWESWSPWHQDDPDMEMSYSGSEYGAGAIFEWAGDSDSGAGRMTITESRPDEYIEIRLEFIEPFESTSTTTFDFEAVDNQTTKVTWGMSGENTFASKAFGLLMDIEDLVGEDYERGLANLDEFAQEMTSQDLEEDASDDGDAQPDVDDDTDDAGFTGTDCDEIDDEVYGNLELEADLNGNGRTDLAMENLQECGATTCNVDILASCEDGGFEVVARFGYFGMVEATDETTDGWSNLEVSKRGGLDDEGLPTTSHVIYAWDGETYVSTE